MEPLVRPCECSCNCSWGLPGSVAIGSPPSTR